MPSPAPGTERLAGGVDEDSVPAISARPPASRAWRWAGAAIFLLVIVVVFDAYLHLSKTYPENSDEANILLMAGDLAHGNLYLSGWTVSDVPFITTELPEIALLVKLFGMHLDTAHIAAALTYTVAVAIALLLAKGRARGPRAVARMGIALAIMLAPQPGVGVFVLVLLLILHAVLIDVAVLEVAIVVRAVHLLDILLFVRAFLLVHVLIVIQLVVRTFLPIIIEVLILVFLVRVVLLLVVIVTALLGGHESGLCRRWMREKAFGQADKEDQRECHHQNQRL